MGDSDKGTVPNLKVSGSWYLIDEAECLESLDTMEELFDNSTDGSDISNLIDDVDNCSQGNSLALFNEQLVQDSNNAVAALKRKLVGSPVQTVAELSPRLEAVSISPQKPQSKRRLFGDSGIVEDEAENTFEQVVDHIELSNESADNTENSPVDLTQMLNSSNYKAVLYSKCKEKYGVSFTDLTRQFKSSKTCSNQWVIFVHAIRSELLEASKLLLQQQCEFLQTIIYDFDSIYLTFFKSAKNRETVQKLFCNMLNCTEFQMICNPPRTRSAPVAIFFFQKGFSNVSFKFGDYPEWIKKQTTLSHESAAAAETFELCQMIQWCYDHNYMEESIIAYRYAQEADVDANAAAFLKSNNQAKYVRDACMMVRHYKRQEMRELSMSDWIWKCSEECAEDSDWRIIPQFLKYQGVNFVSFLTVLRTFFKGIPKKQCIVFYGPPDTGKSYFCNTLCKFLKGKVISFMNRASHFWLQPLLEAKIGYLDDATFACWSFIDVNMRNALDGNEVCIDSKHKNPQQLKLPPMLVTTNVDVAKEPTLLYLRSRLQIFEFPNKLPFNEDGSLVYEITNATWTCFFRKLATQIDLSPKEELQDESGRSDSSFRCTAGKANDSL
jgi:hypothetical protein